MTPYTTLYDDVLPELPGAESALALHHIKRACNDFYERSLYSRETLAGQTITVNVATYSVVASDPSNFDCGKILEVSFWDSSGSMTKPKSLTPRTREQLTYEMPDWATRTGTPSAYTQPAIDRVTLAYTPDATYTGGLIVTIAKLPLYAGAGVDDAVFEKFNEVLAYGAKARMMRMPKKPWSNPKLAAEYRTMFDQEVGKAAAIAAKGYGRAPLRTRAYG